jgi:hypothetical protein
MCLSLAMLLTAAPVSVGATSITYSVTELDAAQDTWAYNYLVGGTAFGVSAGYTVSGFDVYFDPTLYADLDGAPMAPSGDWFVFTVPPDPILPANGAYTAQAVLDGASLTSPFPISFTWLGVGTPGPQAFDVFDPTFLIVEQGTTSLASVVPEPASMLLFSTGLLGLAWLRTRAWPSC